MNKYPYILKDLSVYKMPGFPRGLESLRNLADNINIIAGPNASGKSSTARIIQQVIWHNKTRGLHAAGSVKLNDESWEIEFDSDNIKIQRDGKDDELAGIPSAEGCRRYLLALHELIKEDEGDLAGEIVRQSVGGYDLDEAKETLGYSQKIKNKAATEYKNFIACEHKFKNERKSQQELKKKEQQLEQLTTEKEDAQHASALSIFYTKVTEYLQAKFKYESLIQKSDEFPDSLDNLTGNEYEDIEDINQQIENADTIISKAKDEIEKNENTLNGLRIPVKGIGGQVMDELEERVQELTEITRSISLASEKEAEAKQKEILALKAIDQSLTPNDWKGLNIEDIQGLDKFLQDAHTITGETAYLRAEIYSLERENSTAEKPSAEKVIQGINSLGCWLKEQPGTGEFPLWSIILLSVFGILTAITTYFTGFGLLGIILIAAFAFYAYRNRNKSGFQDIRKNDFEKSGLEPPPEWDIESVTDHIDKLIDELRSIKQEEHVAKRLKSCNQKLAELENQLEKLNKRKEKWREKLQAVPGFPKSTSKDFSSFYWFIKNAVEWQKAHADLEALKAKKHKAEGLFRQELEKCNKLFSEANFNEAGDAIEARAILKQLKEEELIRKDCVRETEQRNAQVAEQEKQKAGATNKLEKIYKKLDIKTGDGEAAVKLINQLTEYRQVKKDIYVAEMDFNTKKSLLKNHSLYDQHKDKIKELSIDQAQARIKEYTEQADKLDNINEEITVIETLVNRVKDGHNLEDILSEKEQALNDLEQLYESNLSSVTGNLIIDQLKKETKEQNRPRVFKRANELLNRITNGRYELRLEEKEEPAFKALDTVSQSGLSLSEISTGTRVQLLLSIRLAFVESQESFIKLPLLADELLANSDDERAMAIIEALVEISREGRQVFYFTAQPDEVGKWSSFLQERPDLDYKLIHLGEREETPFKNTQYLDRPKALTFLQPVPPPNGQSHEQYGKEIKTEDFNILVDDSSRLPLWYLIDDTDLLYNCLKRGIRYWGQLKSYYRNDGVIKGLDNSSWHQLKDKISLLEIFTELYRKGRSRPIGREVLEKSGSVSENFIDEVTNKAEELHGNPVKLIEALEKGEVSGFRKTKANELEKYLLDEEYIDLRECMIKEDIIVHLHAQLSNMRIKTEDAEDFLNRILGNKERYEPESSNTKA